MVSKCPKCASSETRNPSRTAGNFRPPCLCGDFKIQMQKRRGRGQEHRRGTEVAEFGSDREWLCCVLLLLVSLATSQLLAQERPNIVLVLADDLGYGDLGCYGATDLRTPHLDQLAAEGLRFTSCYAGHATCSPSRVALLTGRTPTRTGVRDWIPEGSPVHLRRSEVTIASLLQAGGYATCHVGKWHMNGQFNSPSQPQPNDHGFDHWFSTQNNALPNHRDPENFVRNGQPVGKLQGYSADLVVDEAIHWLEHDRDQAKPFFLFACFHEPHEPIASPSKYADLYPSSDPSYSAHHGNISQMDAAFGRLMQAIDGHELRANTIVWFTSDNGPAITIQHPHGSAGPLRGKKLSLYEGGIRVPGMVRWPAKISPGIVCEQPVSGVDFLPTACGIAEIPVPSDRTLDGADLVPVFTGQKVVRTTPLYWQFNRSADEPKVALRIGPWKLAASLDPPAPVGNDITEESERLFKESQLSRFSLYNLQQDIQESRDLAASEPQLLVEVKPLLEEKYHAVQAEAPTWPAWKYVDTEGTRIVWPDYVNKSIPEGRSRKMAFLLVGAVAAGTVLGLVLAFVVRAVHRMRRRPDDEPSGNEVSEAPP